MASYLPPTESLPIFDNQVFTQNDQALTYSEAKKYFVTFPSSQGPTTITDLTAGSIAYSAPASGSFFEIGTNQVSGGTVRIGPTGGSSGVSVHAGNFDFKNNTLNNATSPAIGSISICDTQTSGILNIATNAGRSGAVNINTTSGTTAIVNIGSSSSTVNCSNIELNGNAINSVSTGATLSIGNTGIGGSINIGNNASRTGGININTTSGTTGAVTVGTAGTTTTLNGAVTIGETTTTSTIKGTVNIGTSGVTTTMLGPVTLNKDITLVSGKYITTTASGSAVTAPIAPTQIGCVVSGTNLSTTMPTSDNVTSLASIDLTAGTWILFCSRQANNTTGTSRLLYGYGNTLKSNATFSAATDVLYGVTSISPLSSSASYISLGGIVSITASGTTTIYFNLQPTYTTVPTGSTTNFLFNATRIA